MECRNCISWIANTNYDSVPNYGRCVGLEDWYNFEITIEGDYKSKIIETKDTAYCCNFHQET